MVSIFVFFFNDTATTEIYTLSLHDALPDRSFGTSRSIVPALVSNSRGRYPLRRFTRSELLSPYGAPHTASASADMRAWMNVRSISRTRSTSASSRCLPSHTSGSTVGSTTVFLLSEFLGRFSLRMKRWSLTSRTLRPFVHHVRGL